MKKFIVFIITAIILAVATSFTAKAQSIFTPNVWTIVQLDGDELLDRTEEQVFSFFTDKGDNIVHYASRPNMLVIMLEDGIFDFKSSRYSSSSSEDVIIGYYNADGELIDKEESFIFKLGNGYSNGFLGTKKMGLYMRNNEGYIRIVASKYRGNNFDEKIPTWKTMPPTKPIEETKKDALDI